MKIPTIFFGASSYVLPIIESLNSDFDLKLVVTTEKDSGTVPTYCRENNIPFISVQTLNDSSLISHLLALNSSFAILADFGLLVPQSVLDIFPKGIINIHPSLLPEYRGPTPGMSAILDGKTKTGISIMLLDKELDHGPLLGQIKTEIHPDDTSASLYPRLFEEGTALLKEVLPDYLAGKIKPKEQDHSKATFTHPHLTKETGYIPDHELLTINHQLLERSVRAYFPWPTLWTKITHAGRLNGKIVKFLPSNQYKGVTRVGDPENKILIQVEGKKPHAYKDFLNGYPEEKEWLEKIVGK